MAFRSNVETDAQSVFELDTWLDFEDKLRWLDSQVVLDGPIDKRLDQPLFRGQSHQHCYWKLETTLERLASIEENAGALSLLAYYRKITACKPILEGLTGRECLTCRII